MFIGAGLYQASDALTKASRGEELTVDDWAQETYTIASEVYNCTPQQSKLSYDYQARWIPVIEQQLLKGGVRLAYLLNEIF